MIRTGSDVRGPLVDGRGKCRRRGRAARAVVASAALVAAAALPSSARAQGAGVLIELRPRAGDTLHLHVEQDVEVIATSKVRGADSTISMQRRMSVFSRSIAQLADREGTRVLAITDSVFVREGDGAQHARARGAGARVVLHLSPDGVTRVVDAGDVMDAETSALVSQMPATLPRRPLRVGESWTQTTTVPIPGQPAGAPAGSLRATFRLDSLSAYGDVAFVSMRGTLERPQGGIALPNGGRYESSGTLAGALQVDRRRGWVTALVTRVTVRSVYTPAEGQGAPMHVRTVVEQTLRTDPVDKR